MLACEEVLERCNLSVCLPHRSALSTDIPPLYLYLAGDEQEQHYVKENCVLTYYFPPNKWMCSFLVKMRGVLFFIHLSRNQESLI